MEERWEEEIPEELGRGVVGSLEANPEVCDEIAQSTELDEVQSLCCDKAMEKRLDVNDGTGTAIFYT